MPITPRADPVLTPEEEKKLRKTIETMDDEINRISFRTHTIVFTTSWYHERIGPSYVNHPRLSLVKKGARGLQEFTPKMIPAIRRQYEAIGWSVTYDTGVLVLKYGQSSSFPIWTVVLAVFSVAALITFLLIR